MKNFTHFWNRALFCGYSPFAPGTVASPLGIGLAWIYREELWLSGILCFCYGLVSWASLNWEISRNPHRPHDLSAFVCDEVLGAWITALIGLAYLNKIEISFEMLSVVQKILFLALSLGLFRLMDIFKPGPVGFIDRRFKGAMGVLLDDVMAGFLAGGLMVLGLELVKRYFYA